MAEDQNNKENTTTSDTNNTSEYEGECCGKDDTYPE